MPSGRTTGTAFTVMPAVNARMAAMVEGCMLKVVGKSWKKWEWKVWEKKDRLGVLN